MYVVVGGYCEWKLTYTAVKALDDGHEYQCFEEFKDDLYLDCAGEEPYGVFEFTPDKSTPDLIYYQVLDVLGGFLFIAC